MDTFHIIWFGLGAVAAVFHYGIMLAYFQRQYPSVAAQGYREDCGMSAITGLLVLFTWPTVFVSVAITGFCKHGLMYRREEPAPRKPKSSNKYAIPYGKKND